MTQPRKRVAKPPVPGQITAADLEQHHRMLARFQEAQQLQARANQLAAAFVVWCEDLHERYDLDPGKGEGVQEDGTIVHA